MTALTLVRHSREGGNPVTLPWDRLIYSSIDHGKEIFGKEGYKDPFGRFGRGTGFQALPLRQQVEWCNCFT